MLTTALALLSLAFGNSSGAPTASMPVGCMTYPLTSGATRSFGVPLLHLPTLTGIVSTATSNTLNVAGASWTPNQFVSGGAVYFAAIRTGAQAGRTLLVIGNTSNTLTLDVEDTPLNAAGFAVAAATDTFELYQGDTLGSLFGSTADANGFLSSGLKGGTSTSNADSVQLFEGTASVRYFFNTAVGTWVMVNGGTNSHNGLILYPDEGMLLTRRGPTGNLTILGRAPSTRLLTKFPGGTGGAMAIRFPVNTTLGGLNFGAPGTWIAGSSSSVADTVSLWTGSKWDTYFKNLNNQWRKSNGNGGDQSGVVIPAGTSIRINKKGSATGAASYLGQALPYGL
jgi:uncharacterized protein (TIGR02597 family)